MKILVQVPLSPFSGYGNDGIGMVRALVRWGADVYLDPSEVQAPLPEDVALLLTKPLAGPFDLTIVHRDPSLINVDKGMAAASAVTIGWTMWEYSTLLNMPRHTLVSSQMKTLDALVAYDEVSKEALRPYFKGRPLLQVQGGFWPEDWPEVERDWHSENFYFAMVGNLSKRKGPFLAIKAFSELKQENEDFNQHARLSLKTNTLGLHPKMEDVYPGLRVFYDSWPAEVLRSFYAQQHVLLAPSQGEGKNMPALEFQSTGGTVIATDWGGHKQWLNPAYNYPLDYELTPVSAKYPTTMYAKASVDHLKELMLHTFLHRDEVKQKAKLAAQIIPGLASWDRVIERLFLKLSEELPKPKGERLWTLAQMCRQGSSRGDD